jgi:XTP/dITP diphosphohydrolase
MTGRGDFGFGYDPIFVVADRNLTLAEMSPSEKNAISARGQALRKLRDFLQSH